MAELGVEAHRAATIKASLLPQGGLCRALRCSEDRHARSVLILLGVWAEVSGWLFPCLPWHASSISRRPLLPALVRLQAPAAEKFCAGRDRLVDLVALACAPAAVEAELLTSEQSGGNAMPGAAEP